MSGPREFISYTTPWDHYRGTKDWEALSITEQDAILVSELIDDGDEADPDEPGGWKAVMASGLKKRQAEGIRWLITCAVMALSEDGLASHLEWDQRRLTGILQFFLGTPFGFRLAEAATAHKGAPIGDKRTALKGAILERFSVEDDSAIGLGVSAARAILLPKLSDLPTQPKAPISAPPRPQYSPPRLKRAEVELPSLSRSMLSRIFGSKLTVADYATIISMKDIEAAFGGRPETDPRQAIALLYLYTANQLVEGLRKDQLKKPMASTADEVLIFEALAFVHWIVSQKIVHCDLYQWEETEAACDVILLSVADTIGAAFALHGSINRTDQLIDRAADYPLNVQEMIEHLIGLLMACRGEKVPKEHYRRPELDLMLPLMLTAVVTTFTQVAVGAAESIERMLSYHLTGRIAEGE